MQDVCVGKTEKMGERGKGEREGKKFEISSLNKKKKSLIAKCIEFKKIGQKISEKVKMCEVRKGQQPAWPR